eukprot:TRINITY_DN6797_c0_g1_i3.p1 TRINITY_DN6797_c0_g1~~TRINITY_DN6797_c0_g1_i3.p1  ORF type:complete len:297 (+),score=104.69 TRINITY_DN6797_c0_g1_i3:87-977(+)
MIRRPPRSTLSSSSAASDVYKRQVGEEPAAVSEESSTASTPIPSPRTAALSRNPEVQSDPYMSSLPQAVLSGHERTKSGKMVYELESELKDKHLMLTDSRNTITTMQSQVLTLRRQCSELHDSNSNLKTQMESMLKSQGRVLTKATEVSGTMYLHDLKAFGTVLQDGCEQHGVQLGGTDPQKLQAAAAKVRRMLAGQLVHPLQARPASEQAQIDKLVRVYANVLLASQGSAPKQQQQQPSPELAAYQSLERALTAKVGLPKEAGFDAAFAQLELQLSQTEGRCRELEATQAAQAEE